MMSIFIRALPFMQTVLVFSSALTAYDTFAKTPPSENIRVGGRLTSRQIESIAEGGYKTIISVFNFTTDDSSYNSVDDIYPSSNNEVLIGESYGLIVSVINSQLTPEYSTLISLLISESPKPIYIHCHVRCLRYVIQVHLICFNVIRLDSQHLFLLCCIYTHLGQ